MAIFSLHHTPVGKTTQAQPHTAAAHIRYITRRDAMSRLEAERMPARPGKAAKYLRDQEDTDRANARVADKIMLALPRELNTQQRVALVRGYAEEVTKQRAPWLAAFHDKGADRRNPHCHLVIRDRDPRTGRRVIGMSEPGSTEKLREVWERHANRALAAAGRPERIDRRTLAAQGIDREPTIHEGPRAREMDARGAEPRSKAIHARNAPGARKTSRRVDYRRIDQGMSRPAYNRSIRDAQKESEYWQAIDADSRRRDFESLGYEVPRAAPIQKAPAVMRHRVPTFSERLAQEREKKARQREENPRKVDDGKFKKPARPDLPKPEKPPERKPPSFSEWLRKRETDHKPVAPEESVRKPDDTLKRGRPRPLR